jgi:lysophospholipase L1-like esterase
MNLKRIYTIALLLAGLHSIAKAAFLQEEKEITPNDRHISYIGRWDFTNPAEYASYWGGAYLRVGFTGRHVKLKVGNKTHYFAKIDNGPWVSYLNASGIIDLTATPLSGGKHLLSIAQGKDYSYEFKFDGLILDRKARTFTADQQPHLIEWIGDSITTGYTDEQANVSDYAWICSDSLNCEHTQIAYPGINLVSGYPKSGMDQQYFKERSLAYPDAASWDFTRYTPTVIVINLGTNDTNHKIADSLFQHVYTVFLGKLRAKFPKAEIFAMKTFAKTKGTATEAAVKDRNAAGDNAVHFIDTTGWLTEVSDFTDHTHPSVSGHMKAASYLRTILAPYLLTGH